MINFTSRACGEATPPPWVENPYGLISLGEIMKRFNAHKFVRLSVALGGLVRTREDKKVAEDGFRALMSATLPIFEKECVALGLTTSAKTLGRMVALSSADEPTYGEFGELSKELWGRLADETEETLFLCVEPSDAAYYNEANLFGPTVVDLFPSAAYDIEEAGKCIALARGTACVFHLMRVTEAGLMAIAQRIGLKDVKPSWKVVIDAINKDLKNEAKYKPTEMKSEQELLSHIAAQMHAVKIAWRNDVMHLEDKYTEEEALGIFNATKGLMIYLAENL
jgi:hypothetical protein